MSVPRITPHQAQEVERLRGLGRTDRQIEKIVGIATGVLSVRHTIGDDARPLRSDHSSGKSWIYPAKPEDKA